VSKFRIADAKIMVIPPDSPAYYQLVRIAWREEDGSYTFAPLGESELSGYAFTIPSDALSVAQKGGPADKLRIS
jgi:hypothetical protein